MRACIVCRHPQKRKIEEAILLGEGGRGVGKRYKIGKSSLYRHLDHVRDRLKKAQKVRAEHEAREIAAAVEVMESAETKRELPAERAKIAEEREMLSDARLLGRLEGLRLDADRILRKAEASGDLRAAISACRELREQIELFARLTGEIQDRQVNIVSVQLDPETAQRMAALYLHRRAGISGPLAEQEAGAERGVVDAEAVEGGE